MDELEVTLLRQPCILYLCHRCKHCSICSLCHALADLWVVRNYQCPLWLGVIHHLRTMTLPFLIVFRENLGGASSARLTGLEKEDLGNGSGSFLQAALPIFSIPASQEQLSLCWLLYRACSFVPRDNKVLMQAFLYDLHCHHQLICLWATFRG